MFPPRSTRLSRRTTPLSSPARPRHGGQIVECLAMATWIPGGTLTNPHLTLRLEPRHGGRIVSLTTPRGDLTTAPSASDLARRRVPERFGLLSLQLWQDSY